MLVLLIIAAALLYFPALRSAAGGYIFGVLLMLTMALLFGVPGVIVALVLGAVLFVRAFWRPGVRP